jgi:hypothetical protein
MTVNVVEYQQVLAAYRELDSYKVMVACVHRACDEAGFPKPPENEPGIPWRVLQMLRELSALRQRVGDGEQEFLELMKTFTTPEITRGPASDDWIKARLMLRKRMSAAGLEWEDDGCEEFYEAAARQAGEGR